MRGLIVTLIAVVALATWRLDHVSARLEAEKKARAAAEARVEQVVAECEAWVAAYWEAMDAITAHKDNARACLDREARARTDATERAAIVKQARPRARTAEEQNKVVDDETRRRAVERFNRPL